MTNKNNNEEWKEDIQTNPTEAEQIVIVDKMIGLITGGKTTGMEPAEVFTMGKALELYRGYLTGKEGVKVPIKIKKKSIAHVNPNCNDASKCEEHGEIGPVTYKKNGD